MDTYQPTIIIDSGAYSAWRRGTNVDLDKYCDFLLDNQDWISHYVALDVISPGDPEAGAAASFANYKRMRERGLRPIGVYHTDEDEKWLCRLLDAGCDYLALSAISKTTTLAANPWYDRAWGLLTNGDGLPIVRVHVLGEARLDALMRLPWYSGDSTAWLYHAQRSAIMKLSDEKRINFRTDLRSTAHARNQSTLDEAEFTELSRLIREFGYDPAGLRDLQAPMSYMLTTLVTMTYYLKLEADLSARCPVRFKPIGFTNAHAPYRNWDPVNVDRFRLHFVVGGNPSAAACAVFLRAPNWLISYYDVEMRGMYTVSRLRDLMTDPDGAARGDKRIRPFYDLLVERCKPIGR